jgi:rhodanese-related sulfurtransferase
MRSVTVGTLLAFIIQAYATNPAVEHTSTEQDQIADKMADALINKLFDTLFTQASKVGKLGAVPIPHRGSLRAPTHIAHAITPGLPPIKSLFDPDNEWNPFKGWSNKVKKSSGKQKDSYADWATHYRSLISNGLKPLTPSEADDMVRDQGAVFVDVRPEYKFKEFKLEDSINVPLFQKVQGHAMKDNIKRGLTGALQVTATERNPNFAAMAREQLPSDKPIIIACDRGGKLDTTYEDFAPVDVPPMVKLVNSMTTPLMPGRKDFDAIDRYPNRYTMSLKAAYELYQAGFTNLYFLEGGMRNWEESGLPLVAGADSEGAEAH